MRKLNIALLGYGKMGHEIEQQAIAKGHNIAVKLDETNVSTFGAADLKNADVAIEFSIPSAAFRNIMMCFDANVPVVVGTTGWLDKLDEVKKTCAEKNQAFFYASNYSVGVNLFFELNKTLAKLMNNYGEYDVSIEEIHHTQKLDSPSGTAITIANDIISEIQRKKEWSNTLVQEGSASKENTDSSKLEITSLRIENVPGTHTVKYESEVDSIEIKHTAFSRKGFASGALLAAEWIADKKGVFGMKDLINSVRS